METVTVFFYPGLPFLIAVLETNVLNDIPNVDVLLVALDLWKKCFYFTKTQNYLRPQTIFTLPQSNKDEFFKSKRHPSSRRGRNMFTQTIY